MARQDLRPRPFEHLRVLHRLLDAGEDAELSRDGDGEILVQCVYWVSKAISSGIQCRYARFTQRIYQISILQKSAVAPPPCDVLRAPEIDIDAIAMTFHHLGGGKEVLRVVGAELHDERPVGGGCLSSPEGMSKNWLWYLLVESAKSCEEEERVRKSE
jgi:hypothetical protein